MSVQILDLLFKTVNRLLPECPFCRAVRAVGVKRTRKAEDMKYDRFDDIPKFICGGHYCIDIHPDSLPRILSTMQRDDGLQLDPDFQRAHVWSRSQQISYVEYFLKGGMSGLDIFLNKPSWHISAPTRMTTSFSSTVNNA